MSTQKPNIKVPLLIMSIIVAIAIILSSIPIIIPAQEIQEHQYRYYKCPPTATKIFSCELIDMEMIKE